MIPMIDLQKEFLDIEDEVIQTVVKILKSTRYILGPHVEDFERKLAAYHGVLYAVGVASGTSALHLSLASFDIGKHDEVITTPFTFFATIESIIYRSAKPVFVDIDDQTLNMDIHRIEEKITERTKAIVPVHLFGLPCDMNRIGALARKHGLRVIEDCAQSYGASLDKRKTGSFGDTGCFSFYPSKNLGCYGDGGAVITNNPDVYNQIRALRNHGSTGNYVHGHIGFNSRLDEIQAGILLIKMKRVEEMNALRRKNALLYTEMLEDYVVCPRVPDGYVSSFHQFTIRSPYRDRIREALAREDIASVVYYPAPMHLQEPLKAYGYKEGDFPVAEKAAKEVLSLPVYPGMSLRDIEKVADIVKKCLKG